MAQIIPAITVKDAVPLDHQATPYTALQLAGRDVYIREGCYNCHTQMVRALVPEALIRYGKYPEAWEFQYDHPFCGDRNVLVRIYNVWAVSIPTSGTTNT